MPESLPSPLAPAATGLSPSLLPLSSMFRLPASTRPHHYNIQVGSEIGTFLSSPPLVQVAFDIPGKAYRGEVTAEVELLNPTQYICLNSRDLQLGRVLVQQAGGGGEVVSGRLAESNNNIGVVRLDFGRPLPAARHSLSLQFSGAVRAGLQVSTTGFAVL